MVGFSVEGKEGLLVVRIEDEDSRVLSFWEEGEDGFFYCSC